MTFYLKTALFSLFFGDSGKENRTRNGLRVFFGGFIPKCIYPRVTGILIPISTHPIEQMVSRDWGRLKIVTGHCIENKF
jgi:hypothetical protein